MMNQLIGDILDKLTKQVDDAEIYVEQVESTDIDILNGKVNHAKEEDVRGVGIRIIKDQKQGFAYTTNPDRIDQTIEHAINNSKFNKSDENLVVIDNNNDYKKIDGLYDKQLETINLQEAMDISKTLIDLVEENNCNPTAGGYGVGINTVDIINSNGVEVSNSLTTCGASVSVNVEDNDVVSSAYYYDVSHSRQLDLELIASKATALALNSRNAKPTTTRNASVVLDHTAAVSLLSTFFSALNSENKQRKRSKFTDSLNKQVASEDFTLTDDGTINGALRSSMFDDEGMPSQKTTLIKDGVLKNFVYDSYHANKDENDVESTSNAVRSSYSSIPTVGFTNLKLDFDDFIAIEDIADGIIVDSVMGAHTANPITGDFSVEALNSFEIKNGSIENPIKKVMISGNIFDIMMDVKAVEGNIRQLGSCITPRILADNLRIIG